jgi:hypothetical protein
MPSRQFSGIPNWVMLELHRFLGIFTHARSRMIHFYPLNPLCASWGAECGLKISEHRLVWI